MRVETEAGLSWLVSVKQLNEVVHALGRGASATEVAALIAAIKAEAETSRGERS